MLATQAWLGKRLDIRRLTFLTRAYTYTRIIQQEFCFFAVTSVTEIAQQIEFQGKIYAAKTPLILLLRLLAKTTACFEENDTLFGRKRHVVFGKTTGCLRGIMGGFKKDFPTILL